MNGGIDQLVDTYKGNPQPLANQVQKAQQGQPPGEIPADLEEALALQEIAKLRQGAQNQQAMQAGGAQPSVVEKLRQMLGGMQQQAQMAPPAQGAPAPQGEPVMAARGGSIDQLMSNLGRHYAGGGIIAFNGEEDSDVKDEELKKKLQQYTLQQQGADYVARKQAARLEEAENEARRQALMSQIPTGGQQAPASTGPMPSELERNVSNAMAALPGASAAKGFAGGIRGLLASLAGMGDREEKPAAVAAPNAPVDPEVEKLKRLAAARSQTGVSTNPDLVPRKQITGTSPEGTGTPRPSAGGAAAAAEQLDPNSLRGLTEAYIKGEFKLSPEQERDKAIEFARKTMGLDALLGEKERRANEREAMIKQAQSGRTPAWVEGLIAAGKPVRGGLGSLLGQMGNAAQGTREAYQNQDLAYQKELAQLRDVITDAKISGNKDLVKEGMAAYKEVDARRRAAATNATSLVATDERTATSKQIAADNAAARIESARLRGAGAGSGDKQQLAELKALQTSLKDQLKDPRMMGKAGDEARRQLAVVNAEIAKMAGISTMSTAPSAASPSGTSKPGWGIKPI